ncbi:MAG: hypothetical protein AB1589_36155 [Cyanobacteriota bacterium]
MIPSKELTQFSVTTAAVLISLGIGRTAQTAKDTYLIMGNQPFSTNSLSSGAEAEAEAEAEAAVESARRHLATVDNSIEPEWLLDVPGSNQHFGMGLTDQERESILKRFSGKNITYTQAALNEPIIQGLAGAEKGIRGYSIQRGSQTLTESEPVNLRFRGGLKALDDTRPEADLGTHDAQAFADQYMVGENHTTMNVQEHKADNDASNAYITARRIAKNVNNAIISKISSVLNVQSERACH